MLFLLVIFYLCDFIVFFLLIYVRDYPSGIARRGHLFPRFKLASGMGNRGINCRQITIYPYNMLD